MEMVKLGSFLKTMGWSRCFCLSLLLVSIQQTPKCFSFPIPVAFI